jgi:hypothetical protein
MILVDKQLRAALKSNIAKNQIKQSASHLMKVFGETIIMGLKIT